MKNTLLEKITTVIVFVLTINMYSYSQISAKICLTQQEITGILGTSDVKLVFINNDTMYYVDFSQSAPQITALTQIRNAIAPVISPDGSKVTYAVATNNLEYNASSSVAWVCDLSDSGMPVKVADPGYIPRFVKNSATTSIIYSTCGKKTTGKEHIWDGCGSTLQRTLNGNTVSSAQSVWDGGSYNGGISWDNNYISTAESSPGAYIKNINDSNKPDTLHKFKVTKSATGADTFITGQVCNLSSSSSRIFPNTVLYIDFSSSIFTETGCTTPTGLGTWGIHSRIFLSAISGVICYYDVPHDGIVSTPSGAGEATAKEWDYPEWSNNPYYAISTIQVARLWYSSSTYNDIYMNEGIYCINLKDSTYHKIIETTDTSMTSTTNFQWPWLWIKTGSDFQEDSTWLSSGSPVRRTFNNKKSSGSISFDGHTVISDKPIVSIKIYSLRGELLKNINPSHAFSYKLKFSNSKIFNSGIFCIRVENSEKIISNILFCNKLSN
jgi:hypothetical protein